MALTLTPDQQAKLEQFDQDSDAANDAQTTAEASTQQLAQLEVQNERDWEWANEAMAKSLESAQAFVDAMLQRSSTPTASKKK